MKLPVAARAALASRVAAHPGFQQLCLTSDPNGMSKKTLITTAKRKEIV
jgi:hypothetical protein